MATQRTFKQDPKDRRIITVDFGPWLAGSATITATEWVVPTGITASNDNFTSDTAYNYFEGGTVDTEYEIAVTITTDEAVQRKKTQRFIILVERNFD